MEKMKSILIAIVSGAILVLLTSCETLPAAGSFVNPYTGYLYSGAMGSGRRQRVYADKIATAKLKDISKRSRPDSKSLVIRQWERFVQELQQPIDISRSDYEQRSSLQNEKVAEMINGYVDTHPEAMQLNGEECSVAWSDALEAANATIVRLRSERKSHLRTADKCFGEKNYACGIGELKMALAYNPKDKTIKRRLSSSITEGDEYLSSVCLEAMQAAKNMEIKNAVETLEKAYSDIASYQRNLSLGESVNLDEVRKELASLICEKWLDWVNAYEKRERFWEAYLLTSMKVRALNEVFAQDQGIMFPQLADNFVEMLPKAMQYYLDEAKRRYSEELYGVAYILSGMTAEMYDYCSVTGFEAGADARLWNTRCQSVVESLENKVGILLSRRLVIYDFNVMKRDGFDSLSNALRIRCYDSYEKSANNYAWALTVPQGQHLTKQSLPPPPPQKEDVVIVGTIHENSISPVAQEEISRMEYMVGGRNITEVPNPFYKIDTHPTHKLRTVYSQEVNKYDEVKIQHSKKVKLDVEVMYYHGGGDDAKENLYALQKKFDELQNSKLKSMSTVYMGPINATPRTAASKYKLKPDALPRNIPASLSEDSEVDKEITEIVLKGLSENVNQLIVDYPLSELAAQALQHESAQQDLAASDSWGQCMLYLWQISIPQFAEAKNGQWIAERSLVADNIRKWNRTRWASQPENRKESVSDLWENCVRSVLQTMK